MAELESAERKNAALESSVAASAQGSVAAALVSAGLGSFVLGLTDVLADASPRMNQLFNLYNPTGALSGETTLAVVLWLATWFLLERRWPARPPKLGVALAASLALLLAGVALTFPPLVELLSGK